jgi:hypothetical protein
MFAEVNPLPSPKSQKAILNRDLQLASEKGRFDMSRHVVRTFACVDEGHRFRANQIGRCFHVDANIGIRIFIDRQARGRVFDKNLKHTNTKVSQLWNCFKDVPRNQMKSTRKRRQ